MIRKAYSSVGNRARSGDMARELEEGMSARTVFPAALILSAIGMCVARGQSPYAPEAILPRVPVPAVVPEDKTAPVDSPAATLSPYITYQRPDCCGPIERKGPIALELYLRNGESMPVGHSIFGRGLDAGWMIEGGGRTLFFDSSMAGAWTLELGVGNAMNHATEVKETPLQMSLLVPNSIGVAQRVNFGSGGVPGVIFKDLNRTYASLGAGREWYLGAPADAAGCRWRVGLDAGGRYGSQKADFETIRHRTSVFEGIFVGFHTDIEIPCGASTLVGGFRAEWGYSFSDILQTQNNADFMEINLLLTAGVRF
jgi:hypothetical protein